jgi:hypothetical protein
MIQRPQTAYALTAVILAAVAPFTAVADHFASDPQVWWLPIWWASLLTAAASGAFATVLFEDRLRQAAWFHRALLFSLPASGMAVGLTLSMVLSAAPVDGEWIGAAVATGVSLALWAARRGVLADEAKVRSMDRIR